MSLFNEFLHDHGAFHDPNTALEIATQLMPRELVVILRRGDEIQALRLLELEDNSFGIIDYQLPVGYQQAANVANRLVNKLLRAGSDGSVLMSICIPSLL